MKNPPNAVLEALLAAAKRVNEIWTSAKDLEELDLLMTPAMAELEAAMALAEEVK